MTARDRDRIIALVLGRVHGQIPDPSADASAMTTAPDTLYVTINFTRYDEGNAFARMMLAGLGQIHIEADVFGEDRVRQRILFKSKVTKTFAWGGAYGGATGIKDVEDGFAQAVANLLLSQVGKSFVASRRTDLPLVPASPGPAVPDSPIGAENRPLISARQGQVSPASGARSMAAPTPPSDTPPISGMRSADAPLASGVPSTPPVSAKGALEAKAAPSPPPTGGRQYWILGTWEAEDDKSGVVEGIAKFDFWHDGVQLRWRMLRAGWLSGVHTRQVASGTVSKISDSMVELHGKYEITNIVGVGQTVRHSLARDGDGDRLRGYELTNDGMQLPWLLRRIR